MVPCPYLHCELKGLNQNLSFEQIKDRILSAVESEVFVQKYGDKVQYDSTIGVIGWKGRRDFDENPKKALKDKASFEIAGDEEWNHHRIRNGTRYWCLLKQIYRHENEDHTNHLDHILSITFSNMLCRY